MCGSEHWGPEPQVAGTPGRERVSLWGLGGPKTSVEAEELDGGKTTGAGERWGLPSASNLCSLPTRPSLGFLGAPFLHGSAAMCHASDLNMLFLETLGSPRCGEKLETQFWVLLALTTPYPQVSGARGWPLTQVSVTHGQSILQEQSSCEDVTS